MSVAGLTKNQALVFDRLTNAGGPRAPIRS